MIDEKELIEYLETVRDHAYDENKCDDYWYGLEAGFNRAIYIVKHQPKVDELKSISYLDGRKSMIKSIEAIKKEIYGYLREIDEKDINIDYILEDDSHKITALVSDGMDVAAEMYLIKRNSDKWSVEEISDVPDWDFDVDEIFFGSLEEGKEILYISDNCHHGIWQNLNEYYPEDIEHKKGVQIYLLYCEKNGITKEYIEHAVGLDTKDDWLNKTLNYLEECNSPSVNESDYYSFILGYDLLHDFLSESSTPETDVVYDFCCRMADEFMKSEEYQDMKYSAYDALNCWVNNHDDYIKEELSKCSEKKEIGIKIGEDEPCL